MCIYIWIHLQCCQWRSHFISIGAAKLSLEAAKLRWWGQCRKKMKKKKKNAISCIPGCFFLAGILSLSLRHFLSIISSDFIGGACRTNIKYWCGECYTCRTPVYAYGFVNTGVEVLVQMSLICIGNFICM